MPWALKHKFLLAKIAYAVWRSALTVRTYDQICTAVNIILSLIEMDMVLSIFTAKL